MWKLGNKKHSDSYTSNVEFGCITVFAHSLNSIDPCLDQSNTTWRFCYYTLNTCNHTFNKCFALYLQFCNILAPFCNSLAPAPYTLHTGVGGGLLCSYWAAAWVRGGQQTVAVLHCTIHIRRIASIMRDRGDYTHIPLRWRVSGVTLPSQNKNKSSIF